MNKKLTMREALIALAEGKKIRADNFERSEYIYLRDGEIVDNEGNFTAIHTLLDYELYTDTKEHEVTLYECLTGYCKNIWLDYRGKSYDFYTKEFDPNYCTDFLKRKTGRIATLNTKTNEIYDFREENNNV